MNQNSKTRYSQMLASDPTNLDQDSQDKAVTESYPGNSHARNIIFERLDGRVFFLNYSYLVCCDELEEDTSIVLLFTTHTVTLNGLWLKGLLHDLAAHIPKVISCTDARYNATMPDKMPVVNEIVFTANG